MKWQHLFMATLVVGIVAGSAVAQPVASALIRELDEVPGGDGQFVDSIGNPAANRVGGYGFGLNTAAGLATFWGSPSGGDGIIMRQEAIIGDYDQGSFESFWGMSNAGKLAYSAISTHIPSGTSGLDGVWFDDSFVCMEEREYPNEANFYWVFGSRPGITANDIPYFVGGITDTQGGSPQNRGLFFGTTPDKVLLGGDSVPGLPFVLDDASTVSFDVRFSAMGTNYLAEVQMEVEVPGDNNAMVMNGQGLMIEGSLVAEGALLPPAAGGINNENWDNFDFIGITEDGQYMFTGDTNGSSPIDEIVVVNGQVVLREGDELPTGEILSGSIEGGSMNEQGDWAVIWDGDLGGENREFLIVNGDLVLAETWQVDWDGNGLLDDNTPLVNFTGLSTLVLGDRYPDGSFDVLFTADVEFQGQDLEAGFILTMPGTGNPCPFDLDDNGAVGPGDVGVVKNSFGCDINLPECAALDFDDNGAVGPGDVGAVKNEFGPCPD